jgi:S1-C subfamily serine protease
VAGVVLVAAIAGGTVMWVTRGSGRSSVAASTHTSTSTSTSTVPTPRTFAQLFAADSSGVVRIDSTFCDGSAGEGTGFLIGRNLVATVAHVVDNAASVTLRTDSDSRSTVGQVVGVDAQSDVALVRSVTPISGHVFAFASATPAIGTPVAAMGFPYGLPKTLTQGTISGLNRSLDVDGIQRSGLIQTDAAVNPGNSGGPLATSDGRVVGLVDAGARGANGLGFAVNVPTARALLDGWTQRSTPPLSPCSGSSTALDPAVATSVALVQQWASALATGDWATARQLDPALASQSDASLAAGYGGLKQATIEYVSGDPLNLDLASVAYEDVSTGPRTNVYCYHVSVDASSSTLSVVSQTRATPTAVIGWVDPASVASTVATC